MAGAGGDPAWLAAGLPHADRLPSGTRRGTGLRSGGRHRRRLHCVDRHADAGRAGRRGRRGGRRALEHRRGRADRGWVGGAQPVQPAGAAAARSLGVPVVRRGAFRALYGGDHSVPGRSHGGGGIRHRGHRWGVLCGAGAQSPGAQRRAADGSHRLLRRRGVHPRVPRVGGADPGSGGDREGRNVGVSAACSSWRASAARAWRRWCRRDCWASRARRRDCCSR